ncbi:MAG: hypothetical protein ABI565_00840 [Vicinamibacteria bacterium]
MNHRFQAIGLGLLGLAALASAARADVLHLTSGGRLEGVLTRETATSVTIDVGMGQLSVPRSSVIRIERKGSALSEYRSRLAAVQPGDVSAYADLARFATENGLRSEARLMWARVVSLDPRNVEAHIFLGHVLVDGNYVDEGEANRARGLVSFDGRWMTPAEQYSLLRERERRADDDRRVEEARRSAREADDRARRAEAEAARARAAATNPSLPVWGYGSSILVGSPHWGGYTAGCIGVACTTVPQIWTPRPAPVMPQTPQPPPRLRPSSIR